MLIDPNDPNASRETRYRPRNGRKLFAICTYRLDEYEDGGKAATIGLVCVHDPARPSVSTLPETDVGMFVLHRISIRASSTPEWVRLSKALAHAGPFDPSTEEGLGKFLASNDGYFWAEGANEPGRNGRDYYKIKSYSPYSGEPVRDPSWEVLIEKGAEEYEKIRARQSSSQRGGGRGAGGGRNYVSEEGAEEVPY